MVQNGSKLLGLSIQFKKILVKHKERIDRVIIKDTHKAVVPPV